MAGRPERKWPLERYGSDQSGGLWAIIGLLGIPSGPKPFAAGGAESYVSPGFSTRDKTGERQTLDVGGVGSWAVRIVQSRQY
jgi:hypothetical protein